MKSCLTLLLLVALPGCKTTEPATEKDAEPQLDPKDFVQVSADDMLPLRRFVLETKRLIVAEMIRVDMSEQFFQEKMGVTRDVRFVAFISDDINRTEFSYYSGWKPYFEWVDDKLVLRNVPVPRAGAPKPPYATVHAVLGYSFLANAVLRRIAPWWAA